jgi:hypothetical protein
MSNNGQRAVASLTDIRQLTASTVRTTFESVFSRGGSVTIIDECRRCGTNVRSARVSCPNCTCDEIVEYRIR